MQYNKYSLMFVYAINYICIMCVWVVYLHMFECVKKISGRRYTDTSKITSECHDYGWN